MKKIWEAFKSRLSMRCVEPCNFVDIVSGKEVGIWVDYLGKYYMADSGRWGCRAESPNYLKQKEFLKTLLEKK
jgi:hypothetical protein